MIVLIIDDEASVLSPLFRALAREPDLIPEPCLVRDEKELTRALDRITSLVTNRDPFVVLCDFEMGDIAGIRVLDYYHEILATIADMDEDLDLEQERARFVFHTGNDYIRKQYRGLPKGDLETIKRFIKEWKSESA